MAILERLLRRERTGKVDALIPLADEALPLFQELVNNHARWIIDYSPKRLRNHLEANKALVAIVDKRRGPILKLVAHKDNRDGRNYLVVVVNARKLINSTIEQRNGAMSDLVEQYEKHESRMADREVFATHSRGNDWSAMAKVALRGNGFNPKKARLMLYG